MAALLLVAAQTIAVGAQAAWERVPLSPPPNGGEPIGRWSGGAYLAIEEHSSAAPMLLVYNQSGELFQRVTVEIPGAGQILILNDWFARRADGYLAVVGAASGVGFLDIISPSAKSQTVVRLFPYGAEAVTFGPDGTIWTAGIENHDDPGTRQDYLILRRFDITGKQVGGAVPRSEFPVRSAPTAASVLVSSKDRVGWFSPFGQRYMEFTAGGKELAAYALSVPLVDIRGFALCDDNRAWLGISGSAEESQGLKEPHTVLASLDRAQGTWTKGEPQAYVHIHGCSGTTLIGGSYLDELKLLATR
ncbi:MAG TPA: hypothetical protein VMT86_17955 [Bryobacteraceae bacterium]|nr:hypothetical protein [Bryobacteraceae bacterium]